MATQELASAEVGVAPGRTDHSVLSSMSTGIVTMSSLLGGADIWGVQVLLKKVIGPYSRARIPFLAKKINCDEREVERLLASLIMDGRIDGYIDQVEQLLVLSRKPEVSEGVNVNKYAQLDKIVQTIGTMQKTLLTKASV